MHSTRSKDWERSSADVIAHQRPCGAWCCVSGAGVSLGRFGEPEEIARVVHFLAADAAGYITGQVWGVNGGLDM